MKCYQLSVTSYQLSVTSYQLSVTKEAQYQFEEVFSIAESRIQNRRIN